MVNVTFLRSLFLLFMLDSVMRASLFTLKTGPVFSKFPLDLMREFMV
jgi:hypothetical protein